MTLFQNPRAFGTNRQKERKSMLLKGKGAKIHSLFGNVEIDCSWCGSGVPVPAGDFCGVCIDCGTVMFRPVEKICAMNMIRTDVRGSGGAFIPAPAG